MGSPRGRVLRRLSPTSSHIMTSCKFRVAVCGGGVGGMLCALALSQFPDIEVDIYEATAHFGEVGAGIGIWPRTWDILEKLGVHTDLEQLVRRQSIAEDVLAFTMRKSDIPEGFDFYSMVTKGGLSTSHRADFHGVLLKHLPPSCGTHLSKRLRSYSQSPSGSIQLLFADGTSATCDILVGADGLKSPVRATLLGRAAQAARDRGDTNGAHYHESCVSPKWSGETCYRTVIPAGSLRQLAPGHRLFTQPTVYSGKAGYIVAYPISQGAAINIAAFRTQHDLKDTTFAGPWVTDVSGDEFQACYPGWEWEVQQLLQARMAGPCVDGGMRWAIHQIKPLKSFVSERAALLGDAAHAMTPAQGSGAGQAIEDAYLLAAVLGHAATTKDTLPRALAVYDAIRRPFAQDIVERSYQNGEWYSFDGDDFDVNAPQEAQQRTLEKLGEMMKERWQWAWTTTLDGALAEVDRMLRTEA
ncbi:hypothetical protein PLICRDRAFT_165768 [Plicaturopsis crispa FD-325 SS-3]|nr:hypothetical protein PLICRDRAFT_165768 [Plicaturopsis crispa FD-325 SS-3]